MNELKNLISHTNLIDDRTKCLFVCRVYVFDLQPRPKEKKNYFSIMSGVGAFLVLRFLWWPIKQKIKLGEKKLAGFKSKSITYTYNIHTKKNNFKDNIDNEKKIKSKP